MGIRTSANQQAEHDLRILKLAILGKANPAQVVFVFRFEVQTGHVVEDHADLTEDRSGVFVGNPLGLRSVLLVETVQEAVDLLDRDGLAVIAIKVVDCLELTGGVSQPSDNDVAEERLGDCVKPDLIEKRTEDEFRPQCADRGILKRLDYIQSDRITLLVYREQRILPALPGDVRLPKLDKAIDLLWIT